MGGPGSTRWGQHQRKRTAEECLILDLRILLRERRRLRQDRLEGIITWPKLDRPASPARCGFVLEVVDRHASWLELQYQAHGESMICRITLICSPSFGGRHNGFQWFGVCPGDDCGRLVWKLFCPSWGRHFRCVRCHGN
jgi:hypothetical protein